MSEKKIVRFGQIGRLKPDMIERYETLHAATWPGVLAMITECNLRNYSIFRMGEEVFSYFEYVGDDYEADMAKMAADPETQRWWDETHPCFAVYDEDHNAPIYLDMKQIFFYE